MSGRRFNRVGGYASEILCLYEFRGDVFRQFVWIKKLRTDDSDICCNVNFLFSDVQF